MEVLTVSTTGVWHDHHRTWRHGHVTTGLLSLHGRLSWAKR